MPGYVLRPDSTYQCGFGECYYVECAEHEIAKLAMEYAEGQCECVEVFTLRKTMVHAKPECMAYEDHCEAVSEAMRGC